MIGITDNYSEIFSPDFKEEGSTLYLLGSSGYSLAGSQYSIMRDEQTGSLEPMDLEELASFRRLIIKHKSSAMINSIHDISTGGLIISLLEMSFGSEMGFKVDISSISPVRVLNKLFSESGNRFIFEVARGKEAEFEEAFKGVMTRKIGIVEGKEAIVVNDEQIILHKSIESLRTIWETGLETIVG